MNHQEFSASRSRRDRGSVLVLFATVLTAVLLVVGLSVDLGTAYMARANLTKAVDAAALAAARTPAIGAAGIQSVALKVAASNFKVGGAATYTFDITSDPGAGTRIEMQGEYDAPTFFTRLFGKETFTVRATGTALRYPIDMVMVLDSSESMAIHGIWNDLRTYGEEFLEYFDETTDRVGIVSYSTIATLEMAMRQDFISPGQSAIHSMNRTVDTNLEEGLRLAKTEFDTHPASGPSTRRVLLIITDGRPTAFRDNINVVDAPPDFFDGVVAAETELSGYRGLFTPDIGKRVKKFKANGSPALAANNSTSTSPVPEELPGGLPVSDPLIRNVALQQAEARANAIRAAGVTIHVLAIKPVNPQFVYDQPDLELYRRMANVDGMSDPDQPQGEMLWWTWDGPDGLQQMLADVATLLLTSRRVI